MNTSKVDRRIPMFPLIGPSDNEKADRVSNKRNSSSSQSFRVGERLAIASTFTGRSTRINKGANEKTSSSTDKLKSRSIPITNCMHRTPSELQLREDEEIADFRDYVMFSRIVDRMSKQQNELKDYRLRHENNACLAHIINTRNGHLDQPIEASPPAFQPLTTTSFIPDVDFTLSAMDSYPITDDEQDTMFELEL